MNLRAPGFASLATLVPIAALLVPLGCGGSADSDSLGYAGQAQDNGGTSEPDRCTVSRDSTGENLGDGTVDQNGMCCVSQSDGSTNCYGCGDGFTCGSIPSGKGPRKPPIFVPPTKPPVAKR
jgi:hypothetical protein